MKEDLAFCTQKIHADKPINYGTRVHINGNPIGISLDGGLTFDARNVKFEFIDAETVSVEPKSIRETVEIWKL